MCMKERINVLSTEMDCITAKEAMLKAIAFLERESVDIIEVLSMSALMRARDEDEWIRSTSGSYSARRDRNSRSGRGNRQDKTKRSGKSDIYKNVYEIPSEEQKKSFFACRIGRKAKYCGKCHEVL